MSSALHTGASGMRAAQMGINTTGNNLANSNTTAFKADTVRFGDTLGQMLSGAGAPGTNIGGTNPTQAGLGVQVTGISKTMTQGSLKTTGRATDLAISGQGFFVVKNGDKQLYTRAGEIDMDAAGTLVTGSGLRLQGFAVNNGVTSGTLSDIQINAQALVPPVATTEAKIRGNLASETAVGTTVTRDIPGYDANGNGITVTMAFTRTATGWDMNLTTPGGTTAGVLGTDTTLTAGGVTVDLSEVTSYAGVDSVAFSGQNGSAAGTVESFAIGKDGSVVASFSNGRKATVAMIALAAFTNPEGLERAGDNTFVESLNSGNARIGTPGTGGTGAIAAGTLETSNVDMSGEMTNLIIFQRAYQADARVVTTADTLLEEAVNLKR